MRTLLKSCLLLLFFHPHAYAMSDRIELVNGSVLIGKFLDADNGSVSFETEFAGTLKVSQAQIIAMDVRSELTLQLEDGSIVKTDSLVVAEQTMALDAAIEANYALAQLTRINPEPWELGNGYRHTGIVSSAFSLQRGNTVRDDLAYQIDSRWRGLDDRYTLKIEGEVREANRERNAENWMITGKYDRFQTGDYYWGFAAILEENRFADLDLRTTVGPYVGRSLFENTPFVLEVETGLSHINEDFGEAADRSYVGLTWSLHSESDYFGADSRLYLDHSGVQNLDERGNTIINTTFGLAFPLIAGVEGATEVVLDYNSGAVADTEKLDQTYRFRLGYSW